MLLARTLRQERKLLSYLAGLLLFTQIAQSMPATADEFKCRDVDPVKTGHNEAFQELFDTVGLAPVEFAYCTHETSPRWRARWDPTETGQYYGQSWPRYLTARCWDAPTGPNCHITNHVVLGSSHVVVDIERCEVGIDDIAGISKSVDEQYPGHEMKEIEHIEVHDGGAWSASKYGYNVTLIEPPEYTGGSRVRFVKQCETNICQWTGIEKTGTWLSGTRDLPGLRRERGSPLIEFLQP